MRVEHYDFGGEKEIAFRLRAFELTVMESFGVEELRSCEASRIRGLNKWRQCSSDCSGVVSDSAAEEAAEEAEGPEGICGALELMR